MNRNYKIGIVSAVIAAVMVIVPVYLYWAYGTVESIYRRGVAAPFWTNLKNDTNTIEIRQGETKTVDVELHYWKGLRTLLGLKFEAPDTEQGGLYNPPDGLDISFNLDGAYIQVDNGKIAQIFSYRNVTLKQPSEIELRPEGGDLVAAEIGSVTVSVSKDVPVGDYNFGLNTADAGLDRRNSGNSQLLAIRVAKAPLGGVACQDLSLCTYQLELGDRIYPINFRFNGTIENMTAYTATQTLTITLKAPSSSNLEIAIPRAVLDPRDGADGKSGNDADFAVFADEVNVAAYEYSTKDTKWAEALGISQNPEEYRILIIPLMAGTGVVEIVGTWLI